MTQLTVFAQDKPETPVLVTDDDRAMRAALAEIGVHLDRWTLQALPDDADAGQILTAYAPQIDALKARGGYRTVDVASITPDHPDRAKMRGTFLDEHSHAEDEVRFFVRGGGLFTLHSAGRVWSLHCTAGDLINVPAGMAHWFDMGPEPCFTAIRLFTNPDGWVATFTGDDIASRFPRFVSA
ncbi:acireductone dioxygenase [Blastomonas sp.]|uniref:1,2-dihydroxy-3-keto-5-methylthiopentene dioxygenase n=1 Tax=Blastomonas sp. TaxID=1909299 RepID=UPI0035948C1E